MSDRTSLVVRIVWAMIFLFAVIAAVTGTSYALREPHQIRPSFQRLGLDYDVDYEGPVTVSPRDTHDPRAKGNIVAIDAHPVDPHILVAPLAQRLAQMPGPLVKLTVRRADGSITVMQRKVLPQSAWPPRKDAPLRMAIRLAFSLLAVGIALLCSILLALRRPRDPVAMLFAISFASMAAAVDPPLPMWMAYGLARVDDTLGGIWFCSMLVALATFPDGIFVPRFYRWILWLGAPLALVVCWPSFNATMQSLLAGVLMLAALVGQVRRFRRLDAGIERQQIKWAFFGFSVGLVIMFTALVLVAFLPDDHSRLAIYGGLAVVALFSLGIAIIPLGLLIALTRFRLWEADTVITRSAAYAVVTLVVGVVWAASSDLVKMIIEQVMGRESQTGATAVSAVIAAGVFSPTQSLVLGWTRKRFGGPVERMRAAARRLKNSGLTETPAEVGTRALAIIDDVIHPSASAIVLDTALSREMVAARNVSSAEDPELIEKLNLADEESSVGTLLIGRRSDGNRYNRQQLEAIEELIPALAEALRVARSHFSRESVLQQRLDEMAARLAQLEGTPKPA